LSHKFVKKNSVNFLSPHSSHTLLSHRVWVFWARTNTYYNFPFLWSWNDRQFWFASSSHECMYDCWKNNIVLRWTTNQHWRNYANVFSFKSSMNASRNPFSTVYWRKNSIIIRIFIVNDNLLMQLIFKMELYSVHIHFAPLEILSARPLLVGIDKLIRFYFLLT
jgi:hypothetical protein